ncbi:AAA family ATPase [uncultured Thiodictyon sp.]|jgi:AAA15 family ATPase/GTPase|uniref:AAA family ATPase n=1 Tax=uncultured Thiodictyon sp. TaxID=1846217 RepID=UPI0025DD13A4|nr:ATP-binding protein [uncultured Thiodictyon sp.]
MAKKTSPPATGIRLSRLSIENYKKLDRLEIDFPPPLMAGDLDIMVLGSKNGGGKTSVLECCSLLTLAGATGKPTRMRESDSGPIAEILSLLVTAGCEKAVIVGDFEQDSKRCKVTLKISRKGFDGPQIAGDSSIFDMFRRPDDSRQSWLGGVDQALNSILALWSEPLVMPPLLHFNSYRKVQEANPELGMIAADYDADPRSSFAGRIYSGSIARRSVMSAVSAFKLEILRSLMGKASLFEGLDNRESADVLDTVNGLIDRYCGGRIEQLGSLPGNRADLRIKLNNSPHSFSFNGLSSGQKEIIATLFLIWRNTAEQPGIVLIDEPELHLNAEWHGDFVEQLRKLAPRNQYILATHSEEIFRSVDESRRALLVPDDIGSAR